MPSPLAFVRWLLCTGLSAAALAAQGEPVPKALQVAIGMQQRGLHEEAARYFGEFLSKTPQGPFAAEAHYRLGVSEVELGRSKAAALSFGAALHKANKDFSLRPECRYRLGNLLQAQGQFVAAAEQFEGLGQEAGDKHYLAAAAAYAAGECRRDAGDDARAKVAFSAAATIAAREQEQVGYGFAALYQLGFCELRQRAYAPAAMAFAAAAKVAADDGSRGECWFLCGDAALRVPDLDAAAQAFETACKLPGEFVDDAWHGRGFVAIARGDGDSTRRCFLHLVKEHADSPLCASARLELARSWYREGEPGKALIELQELAKLRPADTIAAQARELQGLCALAGGDANAAVQSLQRALAAAEPADKPRLAVAVGEAHANLQQWDEALAAYEQVPATANSELRGDALYGACFALHALGRYADSNARAAQLLALQPRHRLAGEAQFAIAENHFLLRDYSKAKASYAAIAGNEAAGELADKAAFKAAWCSYLSGDRADAAKQFGAVAASRSHFAEEALSMQALALAENGDDDAALAAADRYLARHAQGQFVDRAQRIAAKVLQQRGDLAGARQRLAKAAAAAQQQQGYDAGADRLQQADLAFRQGDFKAAESLYGPLLERSDAIGARAACGRAWCAFELGDDVGCAQWLAVADNHPALGDEAAGALDLRVALHHRQQDWSAAVVAGKAFLQRFQTHARRPHVGYAVGVAQARAGEHAAACTTLQAVAKDNAHPRPDLVQYELAWACRRAGDEPAALAAFAIVAKSSADQDLAGEAQLHLGSASLLAGDLPNARQVLRAVEGRHRGRALYQLAFAEFDGDHADKARWQAARALCDEVASLPDEPLVPEALYLGAEASRSLGDVPGAVQRLSALLATAPQHERAPRSRLLLGEGAVAIGDGDSAAAALEEFLRGKPDKAEAARAQLALGKARLLRGEHDRAEVALQVAIDRDDGPVAAEAQFRIGETRQARGDLQGAVDAFVKLPILYAHAEWVRRGLLQAGRVYRELGQRDKAKRILDELIEKHPGSSEAADAKQLLRDG